MKLLRRIARLRREVRALAATDGKAESPAADADWSAVNAALLLCGQDGPEPEGLTGATLRVFRELRPYAEALRAYEQSMAQRLASRSASGPGRE